MPSCDIPGIKLDLVSGGGTYLQSLPKIALAPVLGERDFTDGAAA